MVLVLLFLLVVVFLFLLPLLPPRERDLLLLSFGALSVDLKNGNIISHLYLSALVFSFQDFCLSASCFRIDASFGISELQKNMFFMPPILCTYRMDENGNIIRVG